MTRTPWVIGLAEVPARTALRVARGTCHSRNSCVYSRNSLVHSRSSLGRSVATGTRIGCTHSARFGLARGRSLTPQISPIFNPTQCPSSPSPRRPSSTMRILSSAEKCRRVARRIFFTTSVAGSFSGTDFCLIFAPCEGYDEPEILPSSTHPICLMSADGGQPDQIIPAQRREDESQFATWKHTAASDRPFACGHACIVDEQPYLAGVTEVEHRREKCQACDLVFPAARKDGGCAAERRPADTETERIGFVRSRDHERHIDRAHDAEL